MRSQSTGMAYCGHWNSESACQHLQWVQLVTVLELTGKLSIFGP